MQLPQPIPTQGSGLNSRAVEQTLRVVNLAAIARFLTIIKAFADTGGQDPAQTALQAEEEEVK